MLVPHWLSTGIGEIFLDNRSWGYFQLLLHCVHVCICYMMEVCMYKLMHVATFVNFCIPLATVS